MCLTCRASELGRQRTSYECRLANSGIVGKVRGENLFSVSTRVPIPIYSSVYLQLLAIRRLRAKPSAAVSEVCLWVVA